MYILRRHTQWPSHGGVFILTVKESVKENVPVDTERTLEQTVFVPGHSVAGDYVELEAKMNALAVISNCPQVNNPCNGGNPTAIRIVISS